MTLQQLRYVIQVVESGSFNSAAKALFISQPSLSKAIHDLEEEMSICLFVRTNKGILLSEQGEKFLGYARQVVEQANLLEEQYKNAVPARTVFAISSQHYAFVVNAFVALVKEYTILLMMLKIIAVNWVFFIFPILIVKLFKVF